MSNSKQNSYNQSCKSDKEMLTCANTLHTYQTNQYLMLLYQEKLCEKGDVMGQKSSHSEA